MVLRTTMNLLRVSNQKGAPKDRAPAVMAQPRRASRSSRIQSETGIPWQGVPVILRKVVTPAHGKHGFLADFVEAVDGLIEACLQVVRIEAGRGSRCHSRHWSGGCLFRA